MITIKCKRKGGFRRCGVRHPEGSTEYPEGAFTAKQIAELKGEKHLAVEIGAPEDPYEAMTVKEITARIAGFQSIDDLPKMKKADLIECLKRHEAQAKELAEEKGSPEA